MNHQSNSANAEKGHDGSSQPDRLNSSQQLHLLSSCRYADQLLAEVQSILFASTSQSPFPKYRADLAPVQVNVVEDYIARIRSRMVRVLTSQGIGVPAANLDARRSIRVNLEFADIAFEECRPDALRGYGEVPESLVPELNGLVQEMKGLLGQLSSYLAQDLGKDLEARLRRLEGTRDEIGLLKTLERIIQERGLVEFRSTLSIVLDKLEGNTFQIAVFGRVSSGKSSLLNHLLETSVLPVGVNPITTVPTRIVHSPAPELTVSYVEGKVERTEIGRLAEFVSEEFNPANGKHVTRLVVGLPSPRLRDGITLVDTPGLGSLATAGAAETLAYLPRCDLGVVLVDAGSTLTTEDLATLRSLHEAGTPARVLLSKADLLNPADRAKSVGYVARHIRSELGMDLSVHPVSIRGDEARLLDEWFAQELQPLFAREQELSQLSLRRKIGTLRQRVEAALSVRLELPANRPARNPKRLRAAELQLRKATGRFEAVSSDCLQTADGVRGLGESALSRAASALVEQWIGKPGAVDVARNAIPQTIGETAASEANLIFAAVRELAGELATALTTAASALDAADTPGEDELAGTLEELPRFDSGAFDLGLKADAWTVLGKRITERRVLSRLRREIGPAVDEAFQSYGRLLESWTRHAIEALRRQFEAHAEGYRAQLELLANGTAANSGEIEGIRQDLKLLREWREREPVLSRKENGLPGPAALSAVRDV